MEQICLTCKSVWMSLPSTSCSNCGGTNIEEFDVAKHGRSLVSGANSWNRVIKKWENHPLFEEVMDDCLADNCASAPTMMNKFIQRLIDKSSDLGYK